MDRRNWVLIPPVCASEPSGQFSPNTVTRIIFAATAPWSLDATSFWLGNPPA